jgi:citrate lyase subunit beta/citryl-CoA lyase
MRSLLFVPAHNQKLMNSAAKTSADILLLDIEDSVQPLENKQVARDNIKAFVESGKFKNRVLFPRINDRESGQLLKDVMQLTIKGVNGFMIPKSKTGEDVYFFDKLLETVEYEKGIKKGTFKIIPLIETASAVLHVEEICRASSRVVAVAYGSEDFITDLEGVHDYAHTSLFTPRAMIAMGARAANVIPIDTVHIRVHDLEDLEKNLIISKNLGFEGMLVLHPKELNLVHTYFSPSQTEIGDAREMLDFAKEAESKGLGVAIRNGKFIGPPMIKAAKKVLFKQNLIDSNE